MRAMKGQEIDMSMVT